MFEYSQGSLDFLSSIADVLILAKNMGDGLKGQCLDHFRGIFSVSGRTLTMRNTALALFVIKSVQRKILPTFKPSNPKCIVWVSLTVIA